MVYFSLFMLLTKFLKPLFYVFFKVIHFLNYIKFTCNFFHHLQICITDQFGMRAQFYFEGLIFFQVFSDAYKGEAQKRIRRDC